MNAAQIILQQLGGNKFIAMTGSKNFSHADNGTRLNMKLSRNHSGGNYLSIQLMGDDTYTMKFISARKTGVKTKHTFEGVYCDQLAKIFEDTTGLYTKLF